eukprot:SM000019S04945  [mRNA]  locus=s19:172832:175301:- [translate_table: standard]
MFAGVGPFAVPAALRGCAVLANDLNPASVRYLRINAELNRVPDAVACYENDARDFMRSTVRPPPVAAEAAIAAAPNGNNVTPGMDASDALTVVTPESGRARFGQQDNSRGCGSGLSLLDATEVGGDSSDGARPTLIGVSSKTIAEPKASTAGPQVESEHVVGRRRPVNAERKQQQLPVAASTRPWEHFDHAIMNLPASALEFLDVFSGLLSSSCWRGELPMIHCYCFARSHETQADVVKRAESHLGGKIQSPTLHTVRDVAPNKIMLCLSFRLSPEVAFSQAQDEQPNGSGLQACSESIKGAEEEPNNTSKKPRIHSTACAQAGVGRLWKALGSNDDLGQQMLAAACCLSSAPSRLLHANFCVSFWLLVELPQQGQA